MVTSRSYVRLKWKTSSLITSPAAVVEHVGVTFSEGLSIQLSTCHFLKLSLLRFNKMFLYEKWKENFAVQENTEGCFLCGKQRCKQENITVTLNKKAVGYTAQLSAM